MPASIGVNLRVTGHCRQGGRKYMEDFFSVAYQQTEDEKDLEYAFFGIFDGHGGAEAAAFAKEYLMESIVKLKNFWSDNDEDILRAIKDGYLNTHYAMWREQEKWPKTASGLPSTAGTTASIAFIRRGKIYIGHVGDSGIILGYQEPGCSEWKARPLTRDHKPESAIEITRIEQCGGKVVAKSGVPRVVWNRPRIGHQGPVRRSTQIDEIPFLAVARSLGDLWSYNSQLDEFVVSPDPDCSVIPIDTNTFRCLIFGTDGLFNMLSPQMAVHIVQQAERHNENAVLSDSVNKLWLNPSKCLVEKALERWNSTKMRADNTSVVTLMLDPPGPPRAQVLKNKKRCSTYPDSGLQIMTRFENNKDTSATTSKETNDSDCDVQETTAVPPSQHVTSTECETFQQLTDETINNAASTSIENKNSEKQKEVCTSTEIVEADSSTCKVISETNEEENIQIHEISSSCIDFYESDIKGGLRPNLRSESKKKKQQAVEEAPVCTRLRKQTEEQVKAHYTRASVVEKNKCKTPVKKKMNISRRKEVSSPKISSSTQRIATRTSTAAAKLNNRVATRSKTASKQTSSVTEKLTKLNLMSRTIKKTKTIKAKKSVEKCVKRVLRQQHNNKHQQMKIVKKNK